MNLMNKLIKDPLIHFLLAGLGLFLLFVFLQSSEKTPRSNLLNIQRESLLEVIQLEPEKIDHQKLKKLSDQELEKYINHSLYSFD